VQAYKSKVIRAANNCSAQDNNCDKISGALSLISNEDKESGIFGCFETQNACNDGAGQVRSIGGPAVSGAATRDSNSQISEVESIERDSDIQPAPSTRPVSIRSFTRNSRPQHRTLQEWVQSLRTRSQTKLRAMKQRKPKSIPKPIAQTGNLAPVPSMNPVVNSIPQIRATSPNPIVQSIDNR